MCAHAEQRGPGLWDEVCSPKMQWWSLLALADLFVINRPHTADVPWLEWRARSTKIIAAAHDICTRQHRHVSTQRGCGSRAQDVSSASGRQQQHPRCQRSQRSSGGSSRSCGNGSSGPWKREIVVYWYSFSNPRTVCIHYSSDSSKQKLSVCARPHTPQATLVDNGAAWTTTRHKRATAASSS